MKKLIIILCLFIISCSSTHNIIENNIESLNNSENIYIDKTYERVPDAIYLNLMSEYTKLHYGKSSIYIENPEIIVIHSTETKTLNGALNVFNGNFLRGREDIARGGAINVGIHFIVDRDGSIYSITPIPYIARHTIGLNYTAIGIENIGNAGNLTEEQLKANVNLVRYLKNKYITIKYVIGHYEYNKASMLHYSLFKEMDKNYKAYGKLDPGIDFMNELKEMIR